MKITITDVAKAAGVSKSTVSQYLNKRYNFMSIETKEKIRDIIEELGYKPNELARSLSQKRTNMIGVISATILSKFTTELVRSIEDVCRQNDIQVMLCNTDDDVITEKKYLESMYSKQIDGVIIFPNSNNKKFYKKLVENNYPLVFVDREIKDVDVDTITLDNELASELAIDHFVAMGHTDIGLLTFPVNNNFISNRSDRITGYKKALLKNNIKFNSTYIKSGTQEQMQQLINELVTLNSNLTGILVSNDMILEELLIYCKNNHLNIPEDFSIVSIDDVSFASFYSPPITTISQPTFEMGRMCAELLLNKIGKENNLEEKNTVKKKLKPTLNIRNSVKKI